MLKGCVFSFEEVHWSKKITMSKNVYFYINASLHAMDIKSSSKCVGMCFMILKIYLFGIQNKYLKMCLLI